MARGGGRRIGRALGALLSVALGGWLLYAALLKAADPALFIEQIRGYGIFPSLASLGAHAFLWTEVIIGLLLLLYVWPRPSQAAFIALMLLFAGVTAWAWAHGNTEGCGCFGRLSARSPKAVIIEDLIAAAVALTAFRLSPWSSDSKRRWMIYGLVLPVFLATPWILPRMPVDGLVTPLHRGASVEDLAAEDLKVPLTDGKVFVAFLGQDCPACLRALPMMEALQKEPGAPAVTAIFAGDRRAKRAWVLEHVPAFAVAHAPVKSLRQYYRDLPVFFLAENGIVRKIWWRKAPEVGEVMVAARGE